MNAALYSLTVIGWLLLGLLFPVCYDTLSYIIFTGGFAFVIKTLEERKRCKCG